MLRYLLIIVLLNLKLFGQPSAFKFRHFTVQNGLSANWVRHIYQDRYGFLWIGTSDGLNKYDGVHSKIYKYKTGDQSTISNNHIRICFEDSKGRLWVGTHTGLNLYNRSQDNFTTIKSIANVVSTIIELSPNQFLVGSPGGLFIFNPDTQKAIQIVNDIFVEKMLRDKNGNIWLATLKGLYLFNKNNNTCQKIEANDSNIDSNNLLHTIFQDKNGRIWIGTNTDGLWQMSYNSSNPSQVHIKTFKSNAFDRNSITRGAIYAITQSSDGHLWIGVENGGINLLEIQQQQLEKPSFNHLSYQANDKEGLSANSIHYIFEDKQQSIWVGTFGGGVSYHSKYLQKFKKYQLAFQPGQGINNSRVNTIFEDNHKLYIGTENGLNVYNKSTKSYNYFTHNPQDPNSIGSNAVWSIFRDADKNLWVGLWNGGLNMFNEAKNTFTRYNYTNSDSTSIGSNNVLDILQTKDKKIWLATMMGGLNMFDPVSRKFTRYMVKIGSKNSISNNWVSNLIEASDGKIWLNTSESVDVFDRNKGTFTKYAHNPNDSNSISYNGATVLFEDSKKNIWIGTTNGLNLFKPKTKTFKHYFINDGLPNNTIKAIEEDNLGNLWISTNNGISKMNNAVNIPQKPVFDNYNTNDGLQGNEFIERSSFKNSQGHIYFGGSYGFNVLDPEQIPHNPYIPQLAFTEFSVFNKPVLPQQNDSPLKEDINVAKEITLQPEQSVFTIGFAALSLIAPENNQYAYFLEGFDQKWNYVGTKNSATYTNLDPGQYIFRVKGSNNDGLWNNKEITLTINVLPYWWQSIWAKMIYALLVLLAIYYFRKHTIISVNLKNKLWKEHLEKEKNDELIKLKDQFYTNMSHELRTPITLILGPLSQLMENPLYFGPLKSIHQNTLKLKNLIDQVLDHNKTNAYNLKLENTSIEISEILRNIANDYEEMILKRNMTLTLETNVEKANIIVDNKKLTIIINNLITNALKYTQNGGTIYVSLYLLADSRLISLKVKDTGQGIALTDIPYIFERYYTGQIAPYTDKSTGIGLDFTKKIVEFMGGNITVNSQIGKGTSFQVTIPTTINEYAQGTTTINISNAVIQKVNILKDLEEDLAVTEIEDKKYTIMAVDDNIEICQYLNSILSPHYNIVTYESAAIAIDDLPKVNPDLVLSDVMMPELSGYDLCERIKTDIRFSHIPVVLLTAKTEAKDIVEGYNTEADDYITKPFNHDILKARINNLIRKKERIRAQFLKTNGVLSETIKVNNLDRAFMEQVLKIIGEKYTDPKFNVNHLVKQMAMSRTVFYNKFKSLSDLSINDLIVNYRLDKAKVMLQSQAYTVSQVAYECGFSDPSYFSRVFKKHFAVSPKDINQVTLNT